MFKSALLMDFEDFRTAPVEKRVTLVQKICTQFNSLTFNPAEMDIIHDILSFLAMDIEVSIRKIVSESLKDNSEIPVRLAKRLAYDIAEVSTPILEFSTVLTDDDLREIIQSTGEIAKLNSIAKRKNVSEKVSYALIEKEIDDVVMTLFDNAGAKISPKGQELVFNVFRASTDVLDSLVKQGGLSPELASRMVSYVSKEVSKELTAAYEIYPETAQKLLEESEEVFNLDVINDQLPDVDSKKFVMSLYKANKLTHSIILRALTRGDLDFFYHGITILAGITFDNTKTLLEEGDEKAFEALFKAASMPTSMCKAAFVLFQLIQGQETIESGTEEHHTYLIQNILEKEYDKNIPNMRYFLALLNGLKQN